MALLENINAMPAPTWHYLKMDSADLQIPEGLDAAPAVTVVGADGFLGAVDAFDAALAEEQVIWEEAHPELTPEEKAELAAAHAAEADATYGGTAQSTYQINADAIEESRSLAYAFETGVGQEAEGYLRQVAGDPIVLVAEPGEQCDAHISVLAATGTISVAAIDVVAKSGSTVNLALAVDSPEAPENAVGAAGTQLRVFAGSGARVNVIRTQTLDDGFVDIDDTGLFIADDAHIDVRHTVLGAGEAFTGLAGDLRGAQASVEIDTRYLGSGEQVRDFNYSIRHHGEKTQSVLNANGVLAGNSQKILRGTIDLVRGCKGAEGQETETVLLVDEGVRNKTVPVILCNEDDVVGNHGATIGHIRADQFFYLSSRGLSQEAAEKMFVSAIMEQAALDAPDEASRAGVVRLGETIVDGFADYLDGDEEGAA